MLRAALHLSLKSSDDVRQSRGKVGGAVEEIQRAIVAQHRYVVLPACVCDGKDTAKENAAIIEAIANDRSIRVDRRDDVCARPEVLRVQQMQGTSQSHHHPREFQLESLRFGGDFQVAVTDRFHEYCVVSFTLVGISGRELCNGFVEDVSLAEIAAD